MSTTVMPQGSESSNLPATQPRSDLGPLDLSRIAQDLQIRKVQVEAVVHLLDEGNTIPFITRYRKERTGGLDEEILRIIQDRIQQQRSLAERKQTILRTIENQGKLTDELRASILHADNPKRLEDLYLPYKPKKRSLAQAARDRGLDRLAMAIWEADPVAENLEDLLPTLINPEQQLNSTEDILQGVSHILAEVIAESADVRHGVRMVLWDTGRLVTTKSEKVAEGQGQEYRDYFNFSEALRQIPPHRIMAINRGEKDNTLQVK
ncbi:MAG: Tex-like N-terminal domain-containing protein, partial [Gemmataceae bacterium]